MKALKFLLAGVVLTLGLLPSANAKDRTIVNFIGAYDYVAPVVTHYPNTVYYSNTPTVIYYGAPTVVVPVVNYPTVQYSQYRGNGVHQHPTRNYYQNWSNGWRGNRGSDRYCERR